MAIKHLLNNLLENFGIRVVRANSIVNYSNALKRLRRSGFAPATIFDVGVAEGTPEIYSQYPQAKFYLIDPTPQSLPHMERWAATLNAELMNFGLWDVEREITMDVRTVIGGSTFFKEVGIASSLGKVTVPVKRFDSVFRLEHILSPAMVKIDVQGAELGVLKGMGPLIRAIDVFLIEVSSIVTLDGGAAHACDVLDYMRLHGFTVYDICQLTRRPLDDALAQVDLLFCKRDASLLKDRRWAAS